MAIEYLVMITAINEHVHPVEIGRGVHLSVNVRTILVTLSHSQNISSIFSETENMSTIFNNTQDMSTIFNDMLHALQFISSSVLTFPSLFKLLASRK